MDKYFLKAVMLDYKINSLSSSSESKDDPLSNPSGWMTAKPSNLENVVTYSTYEFNESTGGFDETVHYHK